MNMYTCYQVVLVAEDGEYPQADFQTYESAVEYCANNQFKYGDDQELQVKPIRRGF